MRFLSLLLLLPLTVITPAEASAATNCETIGWITDSTGQTLHQEGVGELSTKTQTTPFPKAMSEAGVKTIHYDVQGGRSLHERVNNKPNGIEAMKSMGTKPDCFVMTMGTNDAANVRGGSNFSVQKRITEVMDTAGNKPVYWMSPVMTSPTVTHYFGADADNFTKALFAHAETSKNLTVIDSKALMTKSAGANGLPSSWAEFISPDGIHPKGGAVAKHRSDTVRDALNKQSEPAITTKTAKPSPKSTNPEMSDMDKLKEFLPVN